VVSRNLVLEVRKRSKPEVITQVLGQTVRPGVCQPHALGQFSVQIEQYFSVFDKRRIRYRYVFAVGFAGMRGKHSFLCNTESMARVLVSPHTFCMQCSVFIATHKHEIFRAIILTIEVCMVYGRGFRVNRAIIELVYESVLTTVSMVSTHHPGASSRYLTIPIAIKRI
jgi:predicted membrane protein